MFCARPFSPLNKDQQSDTYQSLGVVTGPWGSLNYWKAHWISEWKNRAQNQKKAPFDLSHYSWPTLSESPGAPPKPKGGQLTSYKHPVSCFLFCHKTCNFPLSFSPATPLLSTTVHLPPNAVCQQEQSVLHKLLPLRLYFVIVQHLNFNSQPCINIPRELEIEIHTRSQGNKQIPVLDAELQHITDPWAQWPWSHDQILAVPHTGRNRAGANLGKNSDTGSLWKALPLFECQPFSLKPESELWRDARFHVLWSKSQKSAP